MKNKRTAKKIIKAVVGFFSVELLASVFVTLLYCGRPALESICAARNETKRK